jgi:hypothetical protein
MDNDLIKQATTYKEALANPTNKSSDFNPVTAHGVISNLLDYITQLKDELTATRQWRGGHE